MTTNHDTSHNTRNSFRLYITNYQTDPFLIQRIIRSLPFKKSSYLFSSFVYPFVHALSRLFPVLRLVLSSTFRAATGPPEQRLGLGLPWRWTYRYRPEESRLYTNQPGVAARCPRPQTHSSRHMVFSLTSTLAGVHADTCAPMYTRSPVCTLLWKEEEVGWGGLFV